MKYMGSKSRIAKEILPIMLADRSIGQLWVEPFVGGGNMIDKVEGRRIGSDICPHAIRALIDIRDNINLLPKDKSEFTEQEYKEIRSNLSVNPFASYAGYAFSYGGKWLGGWRRDSVGKRDYIAESYRNALKQSPMLQDVTLLNCSYDELHIPDNSLIYCDPPYMGTTGYNCKFNHEEFWDWCRDKAKTNKIFVSEYNAPSDFKVVWEKTINSSLTKDTGSKKGIERLFTYE